MLGLLLAVRAASAPAARAAAPADTLVVRVVDDSTGGPVPWANVLVGPNGFLAGEDGACRIPRGPGDPEPIRVVHVSYEPWEGTPAAPVGEPAFIVRLRARAHRMDSIRVQPEAGPSLEDGTSGRDVIRTERAAALPNPAGDPFLLVRLLPGVSAEDVGSGFRLHGGDADETLVRIDGMEVRSLFHGRDFGGVTGIVPMGLVERLDVYAGAFPARLGGRTSGAIDVELRDGGFPGTHGAMAADATAGRVLLEHNAARGSMFVSAREGYLHRILGWLQDDALVEPAYRDLLVRGRRDAGDGLTLTGSWLRVEDHILYEDGIGSHFVDADYVDHYLWGGVQRLVGPDLALRGTVFGAASSQQRRLSESRRDDRTSRRAGARAEAVLDRGEHRWTAGMEAEREWVDADLAGGPVVRITSRGLVSRTETLDARITSRTDRASLWLQDEWSPRADFSLNLGLRGAHDTATGEVGVSPRAGAAWRLPGRWMVHAAWGWHEQPPRGGVTGDDNVLVLSERMQRSDHTVLGAEKRVGPLTLGAEAWEKRYHPIDGVVSRTVDDVVQSRVIRGGRSLGLDVFLRREGAVSNWWAAYTLGRSEWSDGERTYRRDFDALHTLALANTIRLGRNWDVGLSYRFRTGTPYTVQSWRHEGGGDWVLSEGLPNSARLPDYHRVDVRVRRHFRLAGCEASVWGEALNLTNHDNVLWYGWRLLEPDGSAREDAERVTRTGVPGIPSVGIEVRF